MQAMGTDAVKRPDVAGNGKKNLLILVAGETARAENFSLNGYGRNTNPRLSQEAIINFGNVSSCGTATAVSLPCMFSNLGRDNYSDEVAKQQEGLLDVVAHSNIPVLWRDNNSGCKGACDRVASESVAELHVEPYCNSEECFDEILLHNLGDYLAQLKGDGMIVLHQKGSHGPTSYKRYPEKFKQVTPVCATSELQNCSQAEIVNAYDNTILYTDYFLSQVIAFLKQHADEYNGAMLYVSDHGESLGENNIYLHGLPYFMAPSQQTHVPMIAWISPGFQQAKGLDGSCLAQKQDGEYSHDNLFHTVLGLMGVSTSVYDAKLDIFASCEPAR
jgi:lipid A ethanolaminephosphotransferase